jgi:S-formylglutathione hydrolase FrmB
MNLRWPITLLVVLLAHTGTTVAQPARLEQRTFTSATVGTRSFYLLLPPGYDSTGERYPVVFMLRGVETEWINPTEDASRRGSIVHVADTLWRSGALSPVILVMPRIGSPPTASDMTYLADELIPWIDERYRTLPTRWHRAVDGFSYGGLGSVMLITHAPERFVSAGGYDGSLFLYQPSSLRLWQPDRRELYAAMQFLYTTTGPAENGNQATNRAFVDTLADYGIHNGHAVINLTNDAQHNWYFADLHASRNLPLHAARLASAPQRLTVQTTLPAADSTVNGTVPLSWNVVNPPASLRLFLQWSRDGGRRWSDLAISRAADSIVSWDTSILPAGTHYHLRLIATGDTSYREVRTAGSFRVDNPGNGTPEVLLQVPDRREVTGTLSIRWSADDPEQDPLTVNVHVSADDGVTWSLLATGRSAVDSIDWNSTEAANGTHYRFRVSASDGPATGVAISERFTVSNERQPAPFSIERSSGQGDADFHVYVQHVDPFLAATFRVMFHRSVDGLRYSIRTLSDSLLVPPTAISGPDDESPLFQGKRLTIGVVDTPTVWPEMTRWTVGQSNIVGVVALPSLSFDGMTLNGIPTPEDYEITVTAQVSDTSMEALGLPSQPVRFTVRRLGAEAEPSFVFLDGDASGGLSHGDELVFVPSGPMPPLQLGWWVQFSSPLNAVLPVPGDRFLVRIRKPPQDGDTFVAFATWNSVAADGSLPASITLDPAFPNPFNAVTQVRFRTTTAHWVTLSVVDLLGRRVATLVDGFVDAGEHRTSWSGNGVASGIYLIRVQAGAAALTRKVVLIK